MSPGQPLPLSLEDPAPLLRWLDGTGPEPERLEFLALARNWVHTAIAKTRRIRPEVDEAWGRMLQLARDIATPEHQETRSALLQHLMADGRLTVDDLAHKWIDQLVSDITQVESVSRTLAERLVPQEELEDTRHTIRYVLVELLRNTVQHSLDPRGGLVSADLSVFEGNRQMVQVTVADAGIGIPESLRTLHPSAANPRVALERALWPHISGTFEEGLTGTAQNAGMGLFFIAEMAKLTGGTLLIATRGATLVLTGSSDGISAPTLRFIDPQGTGYPGTLVVFELPVGSVVDYPELIETIKDRAKARTPQRATHRWLRFDPAPAAAAAFEIRSRAEDTAKATALARDELVPRIVRREPVLLDFAGLDIVTQSYLHSLLYEPLRLAWALRTPIYVTNVAPAVRSTLDLLENYALAG
ncbi:sensor histidine kinase [Aggregicoccus sp. 17bor-14]|uniref:ATP-binding protein n=1 Tax=Myxococcaceae TaxID=31 RepID=UPI00129D17B1|nr:MULTISPECIES: ATP-binding protein [Myxococcaceae]MBF5045874.1 sensor histidine kinase [Simulacricoccus sp. 17bor-14]MRI91608.1 sensor histidine kinase [Aggregicoccus sp. 17bor-14]